MKKFCLSWRASVSGDNAFVARASLQTIYKFELGIL